ESSPPGASSILAVHGNSSRWTLRVPRSLVRPELGRATHRPGVVWLDCRVLCGVCLCRVPVARGGGCCEHGGGACSALRGVSSHRFTQRADVPCNHEVCTAVCEFQRGVEVWYVADGPAPWASPQRLSGREHLAFDE